MAEFKQAIGPVLVHEGGFVNNSSDPGGATNFGISLRWLKDQKDLDGHLLGDLDHDGDVDVDDIKAMTLDEAMAIYQTKWWNPWPYGALQSQRIANKAFDTSINMGTVRGFKIAESALNATLPTQLASGKFDQAMLAAFNAVTDVVRYLKNFAAAQVAAYNAIITHNPKLEQFRDGWLKRANEF